MSETADKEPTPKEWMIAREAAAQINQLQLGVNPETIHAIKQVFLSVLIDSRRWDVQGRRTLGKKHELPDM